MNGRMQLSTDFCEHLFDFPKCGNILLIHTRFHGVLRFGHDLGMSFLKQRFHGDLLASFDPGMS